MSSAKDSPPAGPTPANCLRGTWTPVLAFDGGCAGLTYASQTGIYTRICSVVVCNFNIVLSARGSSKGYASLAGLPFPSVLDDASYGAGSISFWRNMGMPLVAMSISVQANTAITWFAGASAPAATLAGLTDTAFGDASQVAGTIVYHAQ